MKSTEARTPDTTAPVAAWVEALAGRLRQRGWQLATAESCTGGLIAAACTDLAGSSDWFERGLVTYSNTAKQQLLGVPAGTLHTDGAVSEATARAMAQGLLQHAPVQATLAVTGIAGPGGGSDDKPVGTVWFAWALPGRCWTERRVWPGDRAAVRAQTTRHALRTLVQALDEDESSTP